MAHKASELFAALQLARSRNIGPVAYHHLVARFGSAAKAVEALPELAAKSGRNRVTIAAKDMINREIEAVQRLGAKHVQPDDPDYPPLLNHMDTPPPVLIISGDAALAARPTLAMVGARNSSAAARKLAFQLAHDLAREDIVTVSGLARGIDTQAHQGAVKGGQGDAAPTIGVIASGMDMHYPPENSALQRDIAARGLLITEYPPGTEPLARNFPFRNRIIAGLSYATLVIEAAPRSGSLITARLANEQGRQVLAIPGSPLDKRSEGCNGLIREGATLVRNADDIMEALANIGEIIPHSDMRFTAPHSQPRLFDEPAADQRSGHQPAPVLDVRLSDHDQIASHLSHAPITPNDLAVLANVPVEHVQAVLVELEITGQITRLAGGKVQRADSR